MPALRRRSDRRREPNALPTALAVAQRQFRRVLRRGGSGPNRRARPRDKTNARLVSWSARQPLHEDVAQIPAPNTPVLGGLGTVPAVAGREKSRQRQNRKRQNRHSWEAHSSDFISVFNGAGATLGGLSLRTPRRSPICLRLAPRSWSRFTSVYRAPPAVSPGTPIRRKILRYS